jgi:hypothetical protein
MRSGPSGPKDVDGAYDLFIKFRERASSLCVAILQDEFRPIRNPSNLTDIMVRRDSSVESPNAMFDHRSSFSGRSLSEVVTGSGGRSTHHGEQSLNAIREWKLYLESLTEWFKTNLADTYRKFEPDATADKVEALFTNKRFRKEAVYRMRNASVTRVMSADPQFFPRYEIRFRNYEKVKQELTEIRGLVQSGESGISPERKVEEYQIAPNGDAILEFANVHPEATLNDPVLRFRVSSALLSETSPIFARMFSGQSTGYQIHDNEDISPHLPPPSVKYVCKDGSTAKLYRMPQFELNHLQSLEILLYAAHMRNEKVPRDVTFEQFVAIAECSIRYKSTSPLELVVEHRWLPQWMHNGADNMPDGMLVISYAFGLRSLFTGMSKTAILNLVDESDLQSKPWPQRIKDKVWAIRCAKVAQVYACCTSLIQEYLREPSHNPADDVQPITSADLRNSHYTNSTPKPVTTLSSTPRCPKGSHWCDASNLGWIMLVFNEMNILSQIVRPSVLSHLPEAQQQSPRSLAQIVEALRRVPSPASPVHRGGVCDPSSAFRSAVNDIFNSVSGLTLYDISGKSHGWALSKHHESEPQELVTWGLKRMAAPDLSHSVSTEFPENVRLKILSEIKDLDDLHSAAMVSRAFYETYKNHELYLMRNILRAGRVRTEAMRHPILPKSAGNAEEKVPKEVSDEMKTRGRDDNMDAITLGGDDDDDDESDFDDDASIDGTPAPSISESLWRVARMRQMHPKLAEQRAGIPPAAAIRQPPYIEPLPQPHLSDEEDDDDDADTPQLVSSSASTPRQASPKPSVVLAEVVDDEPPLTDEEARRILWPDDVVEEVLSSSRLPSSSNRGAPNDAIREKFRFGDTSFTDGLEEKSLIVTTEDRRMLNERDRLLGKIKRDDNGHR